MMRKLLEKLYELRAESDARGQELKEQLGKCEGSAVRFKHDDLIKAQAVELERYDKALKELIDVAWESVDE